MDTKLSAVSGGLVLIVAIYLVRNLWLWHKNFVVAKATGLPYIIIPCLPYSLVLRILGPVFIPPLKRVWTGTRAELCLSQLDVLSQWNNGYYIYDRLGCDAYWLVAPGGLVLITCDPEAVFEVLQTRREHFPRPIEMFKAIGAFGPNLVASEGEQWRHQRAAISHALSNHIHRVVWEEALARIPPMMQAWRDTNNGSVCATQESMRLSLSVINRALFGKRTDDDNVSGTRGGEKSKGMEGEKKIHNMTYTQATVALVQNVLLIIGLPSWFLRFGPLPVLRRAYEAKISFTDHMLDSLSRGPADGDAETDKPNLLRAILKMASEGEDEVAEVSDRIVISNAFLFLIAGHETTASTISLAMVYLALNQRAQRRMQRDLDRILGNRSPATWTYEHDLSALIKSQVGAVMMEVLRLVPPVPSTVKRAVGPQTVRFGGKIGREVHIPPGTVVALSQVAAHRNPNYWPHGPPTEPGDPWHPRSNPGNDLEEFKPERWMGNPDAVPAVKGLGKDGNEPYDEGHFRPVRGSYFPFSEGPRACVGRRFAQIEIVASIAAIFQNHSLELDVREWSSDEEVAEMSQDERKEVWRLAAKRCRDTIRYDMALMISMGLKSGKDIVLRLAPRGQEKFVGE